MTQDERIEQLEQELLRHRDDFERFVKNQTEYNDHLHGRYMELLGRCKVMEAALASMFQGRVPKSFISDILDSLPADTPEEMRRGVKETAVVIYASRRAVTRKDKDGEGKEGEGKGEEDAS